MAELVSSASQEEFVYFFLEHRLRPDNAMHIFGLIVIGNSMRMVIARTDSIEHLAMLSDEKEVRLLGSVLNMLATIVAYFPTPVGLVMSVKEALYNLKTELQISDAEITPCSTSQSMIVEHMANAQFGVGKWAFVEPRSLQELAHFVRSKSLLIDFSDAFRHNKEFHDLIGEA